jgi:cobalamin biosynthesis protein CobD/CbiB
MYCFIVIKNNDILIINLSSSRQNQYTNIAPMVYSNMMQNQNHDSDNGLFVAGGVLVGVLLLTAGIIAFLVTPATNVTGPLASLIGGMILFSIVARLRETTTESHKETISGLRSRVAELEAELRELES